MTKKSANKTPELSRETLIELQARLHQEPGATLDFVATFTPAQFGRSLRDWMLEVSARFGFRLVRTSSTPIEHAVYIGLPTSSTVGDLLAAMYGGMAPVMLLFSLRHVKGFDPDAERWKGNVGRHVGAFIDTIGQGDIHHVQAWLRDCWAEAKALKRCHRRSVTSGKADGTSAHTTTSGKDKT